MIYSLGLEDPTAVVMKNTVLRDIVLVAPDPGDEDNVAL
jgi:hypothetical protein